MAVFLCYKRSEHSHAVRIFGGALGGVLISLLIDRFGFVVIAALFALACPAVAAIGREGLSYEMLTLIAVIAGVGVLGAQFGNNASAGLLYPTSFRSKGAQAGPLPSAVLELSAGRSSAAS